jgi:hypothetical protein
MLTPAARADVDPTLQAQIDALRSACTSMANYIISGQAPRWMTPALLGWSGDLNDWEGIAKAFTREVSNQAFASATADPRSPGTTGDLVVTLTQIDWLACMERAFRMRHTMTRNRCLALTAGRMRGLGGDDGPLACVAEYVSNLVRQSKGATL